MSEPFDLSGLTEEYRDEARQQIGVLDAALLHLERAGELSEEIDTGLQRALHTLKGNSGMLGFGPVRDLVHALESALKGRATGYDQKQLDVMFTAAAALRRAVERAATDSEDDAFAPLAELAAAVRAGEDQSPTGPAAASAPEQPARESTPPNRRANEIDPADEVLRIPFGKLDSLLNEVHELFGTVDVLEAIEEAADEVDPEMLKRRLRDSVERLGTIAETLRSSAMELRLVPLRRVFSRFPSLARDLAREAGKRVNVVLEGEEVELDKSTVDALAEPLLHLVRNAVDHGISKPGEREARGQSPEGRITLRARQSGDRVRIEVEDDGSGLDRARILARARNLGLVSPAEAISDEEIDQLIFTPGFSTRVEASTVSGRGIGMDVVRASAARLRGSLDVEDAEGGGTRFTLELPLTLAIVPALVFEAADETFAIPSSDVEEVLRRVRPEYVGAAAVTRVRDELVPLASLGTLLGLSNGGSGGNGKVESHPFAVLLRRGDRATALIAERVLEERGVVVKPIPQYIGELRGVSGATLIPGGQVVLLLETGGLLDLNLELHRRKNRGINS